MSVTYDKISTRDAFGIALVEAAREYPNLFAIGADTTKSMGFKPMMAEYPDRVINNGIAEQNMAMIGAGRQRPRRSLRQHRGRDASGSGGHRRHAQHGQYGHCRSGRRRILHGDQP